MKIFPAYFLAVVAVALLPGCKFADVLIGPRLPPSESKQRKMAEAQAAAAAEAPPAPTWTQTPLDAPGDALAPAGPATAATAPGAAAPAPVPATTPEAPVSAPPAPLENPYTNNQFYNPEIPKTLSISWASQDDETGPRDAIDARLKQMEEIVKQGLAGKGYSIVAPGAGGAQEAKLVLDYDSAPAMTAGDKGWDHEVKLSITHDGHALGSVSCRWSNLNAATIDSVLRPLTVRAVTKVPPPSAP